MSICLSEDELVDLTKKRRHDSQARELHHLGIPYQRRRDGSLIVLRIHVEGLQDSQAREPQLRLEA